MVARLLAVAIAVCTAATGVLPAGGGARCVAMNRVMRADRDCCPKCEAPSTTSIGTPCCEALRGATLSERASTTVVRPQILPAPFATLLATAPLLATIDASARGMVSTPRARPGGNPLQRYTSVLRI